MPTPRALTLNNPHKPDVFLIGVRGSPERDMLLLGAVGRGPAPGANILSARRRTLFFENGSKKYSNMIPD